MSTDNSAPETKIVIKQHPGFKKKLYSLSRSWNLDTDQKRLIANMFAPSPPHVSVYKSEHQTESSFSFWGFVDEFRSVALLKFLFHCLRPRAHMSSETSPGRLEVLMIVNLQALRITHLQFEAWLECLLDAFKFSAGCLFFQNYMTVQMCACFERILKGRGIWTNFMSSWNKDLRLLYRHMWTSTREAQRVLDTTGLVFNASTFVDIFLENQRLKNQLAKSVTQTTQPVESTFPSSVQSNFSSYGTITIMPRTHES